MASCSKGSIKETGSAVPKIDCREALSHLVAKNSLLKAAAAAGKKEEKLKNYNVPFVKMNGDDWVVIRFTAIVLCACVFVLENYVLVPDTCENIRVLISGAKREFVHTEYSMLPLILVHTTMYA